MAYSRPPKAPIVGATVYMDADLHALAKQAAAANSWTLKVLIERSLRSEISRLAAVGAA
jgi:hypothetical protein